MHQAVWPCIVQPVGTLSESPIELKLSEGAVKVTVTSKVWPGDCGLAGKCLVDCASPGVGVGVALREGVGEGEGVGVGVELYTS